MTLSDLYNAQAAILGVTTADLTINGLNLGLMAAYAVRLQAEQFNDFEFQRKVLSLSVDTISGGSLVNAVIYGTSTSADIKTLIDVTQLDRNGNEIPLEWTTRAENLERIRDNAVTIRPRYPTDGEYYSGLGNRARRVVFSGDSVLLFPLAEAGTAQSLTLLFEAYCYSSDWLATSNTVTIAGGTGVTGVNTTYYPYGTYNSKPLYISLAPAGTPAALYYIWHNGTRWINNQLVGTLGSNYHGFTSTSQSPAGAYDNNGTYTGAAVATAVDGDSTSDIWLTKGFNYILWASVVWLNTNDNATLGKKFVPRTEGNLPPPQAMADAALAAFITNDSNRYELFRRHGR